MDGQCDWTAVMIFKLKVAICKIEQELAKGGQSAAWRREGEALLADSKRRLVGLNDVLHLATADRATQKRIVAETMMEHPDAFR